MPKQFLTTGLIIAVSMGAGVAIGMREPGAAIRSTLQTVFISHAEPRTIVVRVHDMGGWVVMEAEDGDGHRINCYDQGEFPDLFRDRDGRKPADDRPVDDPPAP